MLKEDIKSFLQGVSDMLSHKKREKCGGKMIQTNKSEFDSDMKSLLGSVWYKWECKKCGRGNDSNFIMKTCCYKPLVKR